MSSSLPLSSTLGSDLRPPRAHRERTTPVWVRSHPDDDDIEKLVQHQAGTSPSRAPRHNARPGRAWDHLRSAETPVISRHFSEDASRWRRFANASHLPYPGPAGRTIDPWSLYENPQISDLQSEKKDGSQELEKARHFHRAKRTLLRAAWVPLFFRSWVFCLSIISLGLAGQIFVKTSTCHRGPSTYMALVISVLAAVYTAYIAWDEFNSKPLGLRKPANKTRLMLLDTVFIIFASANLSLAYDVLSDPRWACGDLDDNATAYGRTCTKSNNVCDLQKALSVTLTVAVFSWVATFFVSVFRLVWLMSGEE